MWDNINYTVICSYGYWSAVIDCLVAFNTAEICIGSGTRLVIYCHTVSTAAIDSSAISLSFDLQTGATVTCERSPCQCDVVNATSVRLICHYLPMEYDNASLSCYSLDDPSVSVKAYVHVRGRFASLVLAVLAEFCSHEQIRARILFCNFVQIVSQNFTTNKITYKKVASNKQRSRKQRWDSYEILAYRCHC